MAPCRRAPSARLSAPASADNVQMTNSDGLYFYQSQSFNQHAMRNKFRISDFGFRIGRRGGRLACSALRTPHSALRNFTAFSLIELMVVMALLSLIVLALMAVFTSTQRAFRASVTQTDMLEGSRAALDLITTDLRAMTPSDGASNGISGAVNFLASDNNLYYYTTLIISCRRWPTSHCGKACPARARSA